MRHTPTKILALILAASLLTGAAPIPAPAVSNMTDYFSGFQTQFADIYERFGDAISDVDSGKISEAFDFIREKAADGSLKTKEGIERVIDEGRENFNFELDERYVEDIVELINSLEDMGFDSEKIIERARNLYDEYGSSFVDHTDELVREAVKSSLSTIIMRAIGDFFRSIGQFFKNLFLDLFPR